jgi:hypothetical protein
MLVGDGRVALFARVGKEEAHEALVLRLASRLESTACVPTVQGI